MAVAAAAEVAPRIVRPAPRITRPARHFPRPAPPVTSPARRGPAPRTTTRGARALAVVRGLPDHSLIDRLVRGRAWIPVLGVLLVGIVAMQVSLLQLNASMGRAIEQGTTLQTENGQLLAQVASLGAVSRIERIAGSMGMVMSTPAEMTFVSPHGGGIRGRAIANMTAPSSSAIGTVQAASATAAATTTDPTTSAPSTSSETSASPTTSTGTAPTQIAASTGTPSTPASETPSTVGTTQPTGAGTAPTGGVGTPPAAGAGTLGAGVPSSGGASDTGTGG
jgi:cell division protein FtsL